MLLPLGFTTSTLEILVSLVHAGIGTGSNFPPSTQSHPAQAEASSLSPALSGSRNAARKGEARPLAHPFSSVLSLLRKNAPIPLSYRPFYLCPPCPRRGALPSLLPGTVVSAISHDFKKWPGPQLCHGPSLVLQHLKHAHAHSLLPWTHVKWWYSALAAWRGGYCPMKSVLYIFFTIGHTYTDMYIYLYKIFLS